MNAIKAQVPVYAPRDYRGDAAEAFANIAEDQ